MEPRAILPPRILTAGELRARFAAGLHAKRHAGNALPVADGALKAAAVLIPIVLRESEPTILLTVRSSNLANHPGQIAFPGGGIDAGETATAAALREAREEVGLDPARVEILGGLDHFVTSSSFTVAPIVGLVTPPLDLLAAVDEVAEIVEVPLSFFLDPANRTVEHREYRGVTHALFVFDTGFHRIWGATAGMMANFIDFIETDP